jgi:hypothetical protein
VSAGGLCFSIGKRAAKTQAGNAGIRRIQREKLIGEKSAPRYTRCDCFIFAYPLQRAAFLYARMRSTGRLESPSGTERFDGGTAGSNSPEAV